MFQSLVRPICTSVVFLFILGCTTSSKNDGIFGLASRPPNYEFVLQNRDSSAEKLNALSASAANQNWWKKYRQGLLNLESSPKIACGLFAELSKDAQFPLKDLALLRAHESCDQTGSLAKIDEAAFKANYKYARDILADVNLKQARKTADKDDDIEALREVARLENIPRKKEKYLLEALELATSLKKTAEVESIQAQLYRTSPRLNPDPSEKELASVAMDHRQHREFDKALAVYESILSDKKASAEDKFQALKSIRMTHKVAQNKNAYIEATTEMVNHSLAEFKKGKKKNQTAVRHLHESYVLLARTLWTEDQNSLALRNLNEAQRQLKGLYPMDEVYFILARMAEEKGDNKKAAEYYEASLNETASSTSIREKVSWSYPWLLYKMKNYETAATQFADYAEKAKEPTDRTRAQFWQARALKNLNKTEESNALLAKLAKEDAIGYYGVLAVRELGQKFAKLSGNEKDFSYSLFQLKDVPPLSALQAEWLMAVGENSFSEKAIDQIADDLKKKNQNDEETWLVIFSSYARANLYLPLFAAFNKLPQEIKDTMISKHPELLFPRTYKELILNAAATEKIAPEFTFSIIRQESAFNPRARSPVDAFGLMQLLPSLGKNLAKGTTIAYTEPEDLFNPEINIPLGTKELSKLLKKYDGQYVLAVSAYNASDSAIRGWLKTRFREDSLEFIEDVPYEETKTYIKLVMRNFVFYKRLNQTEDQVAFPEEWLRLVSK